jgi:hypothetical protein
MGRLGRKGGLGEGLDARAHGGQAVLPGGGEVAVDAELVQKHGFGGDDVGGRAGFVEIDEEGDEAFDERGVGVELKVEPAAADLAGDPDLRDAAVDAVGLGPGRFGEEIGRASCRERV